LIGLEDLNTKGMPANHHLAQAVSDASFFEVKRQVLYKGLSNTVVLCYWWIGGTHRAKPVPTVAGYTMI
jgi:hypothetical protein